MYDYDAIVVGSGAGGGPVAHRLTEMGKKVAIIEAGGSYTTSQFTRFELDMLHKLWWPPRWTSNYEMGFDDEIVLGMGRCVGGSTTIFTAIAYRAPYWNFKEWYKATGIVNDDGEPFSYSDLVPYYEQVERDTSVRKFTEWDDGLNKINEGFSKIGHPFSPVNAFINMYCDNSGCLFGCPTEAKRGTLVSYIIPALLMGAELFPNTGVTKVLLKKKDPSDRNSWEAEGVEVIDETGKRRRITSKVVILCAGALNTPFILLDSNIEELVGNPPSVSQIGRNFACNTGALIFGRYKEVLNNWLLHPLSGHMQEFAEEKEGGFLLEASTVLEGPLGFSEFIVDEDGVPLYGSRQKEIMKNYKHYAGVFINIHDANDGRVFKDETTGKEKFYKPVTRDDKVKFRAARSLCREAFEASGATNVINSIYASHHVQGTCRMGEDRAKSVVNSRNEMHDVKRLFIVDGSTIPSVIDVNPSLTIMAMSRRLGDYLVSEKFKKEYFQNGK